MPIGSDIKSVPASTLTKKLSHADLGLHLPGAIGRAGAALFKTSNLGDSLSEPGATGGIPLSCTEAPFYVPQPCFYAGSGGLSPWWKPASGPCKKMGSTLQSARLVAVSADRSSRVGQRTCVVDAPDARWGSPKKLLAGPARIGDRIATGRWKGPGSQVLRREW